MSKTNKLTREAIIQALANSLEPLDYVYAFWEAGAVAFNRIDEWSDIDLYLVVDDDTVEETFLAVENSLKSLSPIKQKYNVPHPPEAGLFQAFYRLEDVSEYLIIDLAVFKLSSPDKFLEPEIHGNAVFYLNKSDRVKPPSLDKDGLTTKVQKRLERLRARFDMFNNFTQKEINRGNYLEAIDFYRGLTLASLVEALRIKHNPVHHDFRMRYIHYELPSEVIKRLRYLFFVENEKKLQEKYLEATDWFHEILSTVDQKEIKRSIGQ
ncbi:MAG: hypothetical protein OEX77_08885 [Candidatus Bathyarchaeota archaeon]|nr:hypothetical protein [Candidatus Bathyarchaeota archaeon]MDH5734176.1 hypothetical protein [Candidatus Bathyarchaeota archaeon]